jgi:hypothetical protein
MIDYYTSVLFKQLIGTSVLSVANSTAPGRTLRVYAFCSRNITGAVVAVIININNSSSSVVLDGVSMAPRYEYHLTAPLVCRI